MILEVLFTFSLLIQTQNIKSAPLFNEKKQFNTTKKLNQYNKEIDNLISQIFNTINFTPLQQAAENDIKNGLEKITTILESMEQENKYTTAEKISNFKYSTILLYKTLINFSFFSEESMKLFLTSFIFSIIRFANNSHLQENFLQDKNILALIFLAKAIGLEFTLLDEFQKILKLIENKLQKLHNINDLEDLRYEYAYYKIAEKIVEQLFFKNSIFSITYFFDYYLEKEKNRLQKNILTKSKKK